MADWFVYMIRCADDSLYTGITTDVERRFAEHQAGKKTAARYLRGKGPLELVFTYGVETRNIALSIENRIKQLPKSIKETLILDPEKTAAFFPSNKEPASTEESQQENE